MNEIIEKCDKVIDKITQVQETIKQLKEELEPKKVKECKPKRVVNVKKSKI